MPPSAHAALVVSIIASVLGALVMCLLVARYGLTPAAREDDDAAARRLIVTRFGHAFAGVCFVATGILGLVAVVVQARPAPPPQQAAVGVQPDPAAEARLQTLTAELKAIASRLEQTVTRVTAVDSVTRRLGDEVASVSLRARQMERALAALPRRAAAPEQAASDAKPPKPPMEPRELREPASPADLVREPARMPEHPSAAPAPREIPAAALPPTQRAPELSAAPRIIPPAAHAPEPVAAPRRLPSAARAPDLGASRPLPARASEPAVTSATVSPSGRATVEGPPRMPDGGAAAAKPDELGDKLREDWTTIRQGLSTAGDDFKAAVRDLGRKLWR